MSSRYQLRSPIAPRQPNTAKKGRARPDRVRHVRCVPRHRAVRQRLERLTRPDLERRVAGEREVELLGGMGVAGVERAGSENEEAEDEVAAAEAPVGPDALAVGEVGQEGRRPGVGGVEFAPAHVAEGGAGGGVEGGGRGRRPAAQHRRRVAQAAHRTLAGKRRRCAVLRDRPEIVKEPIAQRRRRAVDRRPRQMVRRPLGQDQQGVRCRHGASGTVRSPSYHTAVAAISR